MNNNILKLVLGVLAISGLLAILVPSGNPIAPPAATDAPQATAPPESVSETAAESTQDVTEVVGFDVPEVKFGEPSISGLPFGSENAPQAVSQDAAPNITEEVQSQPDSGEAENDDSQIN